MSLLSREVVEKKKIHADAGKLEGDKKGVVWMTWIALWGKRRVYLMRQRV